MLKTNIAYMHSVCIYRSCFKHW